MNILVLSQWFPPEPGGGPARFLEMGREWAAAGHNVHVIAGIPNWPTGIVDRRYRGKRYVKEAWEGLDVRRAWVYPARNEGRLRRILNHVSFLISSPAVTFASRVPSDVVVATSPPLLAGLAGMLIARRRGVPFVFDVRDLWPDAIFELGQMRSPPIRRTLRALERTLYRRSAAVVPVAEAFIEPIRSRGARRIDLIPNGADIDFFSPGPPDPHLRTELGWEGRFVVMYAGTLGLAHGLTTVIEAAEACRDSSVLFSLIGDGADRPQLETASVARGLDNLQILPLQPRSRMPTLYRSADACLVSLRPLPLFDGFIPFKVFEIMACARPILAAVAGRALSIVQSAESGLPVKQGSAQSLLEAIETLREDPSEAAALGARGRRYVTQHYDRRALANLYRQLLEAVAE